MPIQAPQWTDFLTCPVCLNDFDDVSRLPISLGCGHSLCWGCLESLSGSLCPFDQTAIPAEAQSLPPNVALLQLLNLGWEKFADQVPTVVAPEFHREYRESLKCMEALAVYLKPLSKANHDVVLTSTLSRPLQRKLVTLISCQLGLEDGRVRAVRAARSIGERAVTELILHHQNGQISSNLWSAVRARGCQFLGPAMQEETLNLVLLALDHGASLSRKVLVLFVVQRLVQQFPQASKTSVGHVVQLLYRASCFKVTKREDESSLMELKEEFRQYEALRKEHDTQIVQIAIEAGLRISPEQWSSLLYGDLTHKSHMQSIIDKLQTPESFASSIRELTVALQRSSDPAQLSKLRGKLEQLAAIDQSPEVKSYPWEGVRGSLQATQEVVAGLVDFLQNHSVTRRAQDQQSQSIKYKTSMCRDIVQKGGCPRGTSCTFAHSEEELERFRSRSRRMMTNMGRQNSRITDRSLETTAYPQRPKTDRMEQSMLTAASESPPIYRGPQEGPPICRGPQEVSRVRSPDPGARMLMHPLTPDPYKESSPNDFQSGDYGASPHLEPMKLHILRPSPSQSPYPRIPVQTSNQRLGMPVRPMRGQVPLDHGYVISTEPHGHWNPSAIRHGKDSALGDAEPNHQSPGRLKLNLHGLNGNKSEELSLQQLQQQKSKIQGMLENFLSPPRSPYPSSIEYSIGNLALGEPDHGYGSPPGHFDNDITGRFWPPPLSHRSDPHMKETDSKYTTSISKVQRLHLQSGSSTNGMDENPTLGKHTMHEFEQMSKNELEKTLEQEKNAASSHYERSSKIQMEIMRRNNVEAVSEAHSPLGGNQFVRHPGPVSRKANTHHKTTGPVKVNAGSSNIAPVTLIQDCHSSPGIQSTPGVYDYFQTGLTWNQPDPKLWDSLPPSKHQMTESEVKNAKNLLKAELENVSQKIEKKHSEKSANDSFLLLREESALSDVWPHKEHSHPHTFSEDHCCPPHERGLPLHLKAPGRRPVWGISDTAGNRQISSEFVGYDKSYSLSDSSGDWTADRPSPYTEKW